MEAPAIDLKALGITPEDLTDRIVDRVSEKLIGGYYDEEIGRYTESGLEDRIEKRVETEVTNQIDAAVAKIVEKHLGDNLGEYLANLTFQNTNKWGEPKGDKQTFREYLLDRAEKYLSEQVDYNGKDKAEGGYAWKGKQSRIEHWVYSRLYREIDSAVKKAVGNAHTILQASIEDTVKVRLKAISEAIKVSVKTPTR